MENGPIYRSTGGSSEGTVAGGTESFGSEQKTDVLIDEKSVMKNDSDSDMLDLADEEEDEIAPLLRRTHCLMRLALGYTTDESSSDISEDEHVPVSVGETESDSPAEEVEQHKGKKGKVQQTTSANSQGADVQPSRLMAHSCSLAANDEESPSAKSSDVTVKTPKKKQNCCTVL